MITTHLINNTKKLLTFKTWSKNLFFPSILVQNLEARAHLKIWTLGGARDFEEQQIESGDILEPML